MRDYLQTGPTTGRFLSVPEDAPILVTAKPADDGDGIVVRIQNLSPTEQPIPLEVLAKQPASAAVTSSLEIDGGPLPVDGATVTVPVAGNAIQSIRLRF
jgi:alpha-mannosidase